MAVLMKKNLVRIMLVIVSIAHSGSALANGQVEQLAIQAQIEFYSSVIAIFITTTVSTIMFVEWSQKNSLKDRN